LKNLRGRAKERGKPLDDDCYKAHISGHEYGPDDHRKFCYGLINLMYDEPLDKYKECGAYAYNAKPPKEADN